MKALAVLASVLGMLLWTNAASAQRRQMPPRIGAACPRIELPGVGKATPIVLPSMPCLLPPADSENEPQPQPLLPEQPHLQLEPPTFGKLLLPSPFGRPPGSPQRPIDLGFMVATGTQAFFRNDYTQALKLVTAAVLADALGSNVSIEKDWRSQQDVVRLRAAVGSWEPFVDIGYVTLDPRLMLSYQPNARPPNIGDGNAPELLYLSGDKSWYYYSGLSLKLARRVTLRFGGTVLPTTPRFYSGGLTLQFSLDP